MNLNELAVEICELEGLKKGQSIAQVKETLRVLFKNFDLEDIVKIWIKYNK